MSRTFVAPQYSRGLCKDQRFPVGLLLYPARSDTAARAGQNIIRSSRSFGTGGVLVVRDTVTEQHVV